MKKWLSENKMFLIAVIIGLIMTPITYEDFRPDCSSNYECFVYCLISILVIGIIGTLLDYCSKKGCDK